MILSSVLGMILGKDGNNLKDIDGKTNQKSNMVLLQLFFMIIDELYQKKSRSVYIYFMVYHNNCIGLD